MIPKLTDAEIARFYSKIHRGDGCHLWQGTERNNQGYGRFTIYRNNKRIRILAHRLAYMLATGEDPGDAVVRHDCDTPLCCKPEDLRTGTQADNMRDAATRGRTNLAGLAVGRELQHERVQRRLTSGEKLCPACATVKPLRDFHKNRREPDGYQGHCKECRSATLRAKWRNDPEFRESERERKKARAGLNEDERTPLRRKAMRKANAA